MKLQDVKLIIGLGNPGEKYEKTYHNAGFLAIDFLIENHSISNLLSPISKPLKSNVFMNQSGGFAAKTIKKFGVKPTELLIIHDDSDIELGDYKISFGRGSAGHNGAESVIKALKTKNFWRLRIGIRPKKTAKSPRLKAGEFVLKKITKKDLEILNTVFENAISNVPRG
ncbi:MAG: Peptidyl-tRNA hydrolase [Candidatus Curtissbacteria bacterium GW2011_GWA1_40_24]|uniref:Peptidyl-tRNA hydrolase n=2 Tax=Patescibacteria group TaxID=1783273 RepID=A0A0G0RT40_9BACT|nr:MAG: Peptidyl-tRNA hydrolase [Candidatus Curtissbacteria bacterium GW2011_GWA1_40_24]KKR89028.1 MAG: Peptidyl-tRNA hydrolase [Candidatus Wolfebacteria bacterium GW2011_GWB1_41_12]